MGVFFRMLVVLTVETRKRLCIVEMLYRYVLVYSTEGDVGEDGEAMAGVVLPVIFLLIEGEEVCSEEEEQGRRHLIGDQVAAVVKGISGGRCF